MNSLDLTILVIVSVSITLGTFRGWIREMFSLASAIIGFVLAMRFHAPASEHIFRFTSYPVVNNTLSFIIIFVFSSLLVGFIGGRLSGLAKKSKARPLDMILGTALGAARGLLISALLVYALMVFLPVDSEIVAKSKTFPYISRVSELVAVPASPFIPSFFEEEFNRKARRFRGEKEKPEKPVGKPGKPEEKPASKKDAGK